MDRPERSAVFAFRIPIALDSLAGVLSFPAATSAATNAFNEKSITDSGLIVPVGEWVLEQACLTFADWQRRFPA